MITASDSFTTIDLGEYYAILSSDGRMQKLYQEAGMAQSGSEVLHIILALTQILCSTACV